MLADDGLAGEDCHDEVCNAELRKKLLMATLLVVAVVLLITYRSPVLWLLPLLSVGIAVEVGSAVVYLLAKSSVLLVNGEAVSILYVLLFGVGTDYGLLIVSRYREELHRHEGRRDAMAAAVRQALPPVLASAATVTIALLCLLAAQMNSGRLSRPPYPAASPAVFTVSTKQQSPLPPYEKKP
jgi:RND superfamily putative drug exporter